MSTVFLHPKRKTFYHRSIVPRRLQPYFKGREQVWRSLKTADRDEATIKSAQWTARIQRLFLTLKKQGDRMTNEQRDALVAHWLEVELDEAEDARTLAGPVSDDYREGVWHVLSDLSDKAHEDLVTNNWKTIEREADALMKSAGLPVDHEGADFGRLCRRLLLAKQEYLHIESERWEGKYKTRAIVAGNGSVNGSAPVSAPVKAATPSKPFTEVVKLYFQENTRAKRTDSQVKAELERFVETVGGDKPIAAITKADCRTYKEHMLQVRKLTLATVIKHLSSLSGLFKWSEAQGFISDGSNPVKGLAPNKRQAKKQASPRRPFTDDELLTVFGSNGFTAQRSTHPERYWLTLICLFQVCRREEAGQLAIADIGKVEGVVYLNITDEGEGQGLKNEGSKRRLPVHSSLIKLGFMEYVDSIKAAGHTRLFPKLKHGANGYSDSVGKFFSRLVTKSGLSDPALVLHSLRHGGITKLTSAGVPHNVCEMIAGHSASGVHGQVYVHRDNIPLSLLQDGLEKLRYEGVLTALTKEARRP
jgi:integrase